MASRCAAGVALGQDEAAGSHVKAEPHHGGDEQQARKDAELQGLKGEERHQQDEQGKGDVQDEQDVQEYRGQGDEDEEDHPKDEQDGRHLGRLGEP
jgi:hypothetical protein